MSMKRDLQGKVVILTGASAGIGEATACELAAAGAGSGNISKEFVARKLHKLILHPKAELKLGRLYDPAEFVNKVARGRSTWV